MTLPEAERNAAAIYERWQRAVLRLSEEAERDASSAATAKARRRWIEMECAYHAAEGLAHRLRCEARGERHLRVA